MNTLNEKTEAKWHGPTQASCRPEYLQTEPVERNLKNSPLMRFVHDLERNTKSDSSGFDLEAALEQPEIGN